MIKLCILTTDTPHHRYFLHKLNTVFPVDLVVLETTGIKAKFDTSHPFETEREKFENNLWGKIAQTPLNASYEVLSTERINDPAAVEAIRKLSPDIMIDFGTTIVSPELFQLANQATWNLHGGDPERYRGLDSHLWAIYHADFECLVTTLHSMEKDLDTGAIISQKDIPLSKGMRLSQLRAANTEVCVSLCLDALTSLSKHGVPKALPQKQIGKYFSFMPTGMKEECVLKFHKYTETLR